MHYKAVKEQDGTYTIRASVAGLNYSSIACTGVRGCNVNRLLNKLRHDDYCRERGLPATPNPQPFPPKTED